VTNVYVRLFGSTAGEEGNLTFEVGADEGKELMLVCNTPPYTARRQDNGKRN
jgi:hypothetical protein